jgi:S1-C subfamily serine protease
MRLIKICALACALSGAVAGQQELHTVQIRAALVDKDLNVKPVPKLVIDFVPSDPKSSAVSLALTTGYDGKAIAQLINGRYRVFTPRPIDFQGRRYSWDVGISIDGPNASLDLSIDNATISDITPETAPPAKDELIGLFKKYQNSVVTVWSELGHGTGFIVDPNGLILTNQHVVGTSEYIAVQFDRHRKVQATVLLADTEKDVAVIWIDLSAFPDAIVAPIAKGDAHPAIEEGERVFTIGSPINQRKILTTGIVSKVEERAIISDININPGNSGGPLFSSRGDVVGLTTFGEQTKRGPGIAGIVRIEQALPLLAQAQIRMVTATHPAAAYLPVEPDGTFPLDAIKSAAAEGKVKTHDYVFNEGDYHVAIVTPILKYQLMEATDVAAAKEKAKRTKKKEEAIQGTFQPLDDLKNWAEYAGQYQAVLEIRATPMLRETFGSALTRGLASYGGNYAGPAKMRFKTDFYKMRLLCGAKEVTAIQPGKVADVVSEHNLAVSVTDATYEGYYSYPADAISPSCGSVTLLLYSEKDPNKPTTRVLDPKTVEHVWSDFAAFRNLYPRTAHDPAAKN